MEKGRSAFKFITGKPRRKRPLGRDDNIRVDLQEICVSTRNWFDSAQDRDY